MYKHSPHKHSTGIRLAITRMQNHLCEIGNTKARPSKNGRLDVLNKKNSWFSEKDKCADLDLKFWLKNCRKTLKF